MEETKVNESKMLGILGGLGPMATAYFYELITAHTQANCDQDHIDMVISSAATTPDRTAFILGKVEESPVKRMVSEAKKLRRFGAELIAIPCNTAHHFYDAVSAAVDIPVLNIIEETVGFIAEKGYQKPGILATVGTVTTHAYQGVCERLGLSYAVPDEGHQQMLMDIIYNDIKTGKRADRKAFDEIVSTLVQQGCDCMILGCTELSLIKKAEGLDSRYVDSMEVLALRVIEACGKTAIGFDRL